MDIEKLKEYCKEKPYAVLDFKPEWDAFRGLVGNKMFAMIGADNKGDSIITLKAKPGDGVYLREKHSEIMPGYYMNKIHWNSILIDSGLDIAFVYKLIDNSYDIIFNELPKKIKETLNSKK